MSDIAFDCPECEGHLIVDAAGAGLDVPCPRCGQTIHIPETPVDPPPQSDPPPPTGAGGNDKLHLQRPASQSWQEHTMQPAHWNPEEAIDETAQTSAEEESSPEQSEKHVEQHGSDVNIDQPWQKKHDQWFTEDGRHYHYCYYNPHATSMATACGDSIPVRLGEPAPADLSKLKRRAFCKNCRAVLS